MKTRDLKERKFAIVNFGASKTQQHMRKGTDIKEMLQKYQQTGVLPPQKRAMFGEYNMESLFEANCQLQEVNEKFLSLPPEVRSKFANNPFELLAFLDDTDNREEAIRMGLIEEPAQAITSAVPVGSAAGSPKPETAPVGAGNDPSGNQKVVGGANG